MTTRDLNSTIRVSQRKILVLSADQTLASALAAIADAGTDWIVIVREEEWRPQPFLYAFHPEEIRVETRGFAGHETLRVALNLRETGSSAVSSEEEGVTAPAGGAEAPSTQRMVAVNSDGLPVAVTQLAAADLGTGIRRTGELVDPLRLPYSFSVAPGEPGDTTIEMRLAANAPSVLAPGADDVIDVVVAAASDELPLRGSIRATGAATEPVSVVLSILGDAIVALGPRVIKLAPPRPGQPSQSAFEIRAVGVGTVQVAVLFRQGGSELGGVRHQIRVTSDVASARRIGGKVAAAPRAAHDDGVLLLQIEPQRAGGEIRYEFRLQCPRLGLDFTGFESPRLLAPNGDAADSELAFVRRIYETMTNQMLRTRDQARRFALEVEAFGEDLCGQLFPPEMIRVLWDGRGKVDAVRVMSWEPYIPWELIKLAIPDAQRADDRFISEYGMVRWLAGRAAVRSLPLGDWSYYAATYPNNPAENVTREVEYFTTRLAARGIQARQLTSTYDAFVGALQNPTFDVLHVACHGDVKEDNIEKAELVLTDELVGGRPKYVSISANVVGKVARFVERRPLVFLNACEAGRLGESLTAWGGWPARLISAGAGAVVAAAWPVRDVASNTFATEFYEALLDGRPLSAAASAARTATAAAGDATWLAFKVFGDPHAARPAVSAEGGAAGGTTV